MAEEISPSTVEGLSPCGGGPEGGPAVEGLPPCGGGPEVGPAVSD